MPVAFRSICELLVPVYDVSFAVADVRIVRIQPPEQVLLFLLIEWDCRINAGVNKHAVFVDVHQRQPVEPIEMRGRDDAGIVVAIPWVTVRNECRPTPISDPPVRAKRFADRIYHHVFVIALEHHARPTGQQCCRAHQEFDNLPTVGPAINIIAKVDDRARGAVRVDGDLLIGFQQQIHPAVQVSDCVCEAHAAPPMTSHLVLVSIHRRQEVSVP